MDQKLSYSVLSTGICICFLMITALFAFDIYYPSLPAITKSFSISPQKLQLSIALYFFPLAFSQLFFGPLSNRYGRKPILLVGTTSAFIGSLLCAYAPIFEVFVIGRFLQGVGNGSYYTVTKAIMRDLFIGPSLARFSSLISAVVSISPCVAPLIGGYFETFFGWRSSFFFMSFLFALSAFLIQIFLKETYQSALLKMSLLKEYAQIIKKPIFLMYVLCSTAAYSGLIVFLSLAPFIYTETFGLSTLHFSSALIIAMIGLTVGALINSFLAHRYPLTIILFVGGLLMLFSDCILLFAPLLLGPRIEIIALSSFVFAIACNSVFINASTGALSHIDSNLIGAGSALFGCIQIIGPTCATTLLTILPIPYIQIVQSTFFLAGSLILLGALFVQHKNANSPIDF